MNFLLCRCDNDEQFQHHHLKRASSILELFVFFMEIHGFNISTLWMNYLFTRIVFLYGQEGRSF